MDRTVIALRPALIIGTLLLIGGFMLAPARSQAVTPRIGIIDMGRLQAHAKPVREAAEKLQQEVGGLNDILTVARTYRCLTDDKAERAVELDLKGTAGRTPEEQQEFEVLSRENADLDYEYVKLVNVSNPTQVQTDRLTFIQGVRNERSDRITVIEEELETRRVAALAKVEKEVDDQLSKALEAARAKYDLDVIVNTHIPTLMLVGEGQVDQRNEPVVLYGGRDVTDDVIMTMNGPDAPPPPARTGNDTTIPGAVYD